MELPKISENVTPQEGGVIIKEAIEKAMVATNEANYAIIMVCKQFNNEELSHIVGSSCTSIASMWTSIAKTIGAQPSTNQNEQ